jgi:hypothetical protein
MRKLEGFKAQQIKIPHNKVEVIESELGVYKACSLTLRIDSFTGEPYLVLNDVPAAIGDYSFRSCSFNLKGVYKAVERLSNQDLLFKPLIKNSKDYFKSVKANKIVATRKDLQMETLTLIDNEFIGDGHEFLAKCKFWYEDGHTEKPVYCFQLDDQYKLILNPKNPTMEPTKPKEAYQYKIVISPKDTTKKITLENVTYVTQEGNTLLVVFEDGKTRNYPFEHIWYWEMQS